MFISQPDADIKLTLILNFNHSCICLYYPCVSITLQTLEALKFGYVILNTIITAASKLPRVVVINPFSNFVLSFYHRGDGFPKKIIVHEKSELEDDLS